MKVAAGFIVTVLGSDCPVVAVHGNDLISVVVMSNPPQLLVGVPAAIEGKPAPSHGAHWSNPRETRVVTLGPVPVADLPQAAEPEQLDSKALEPVFDAIATLGGQIAELQRLFSAPPVTLLPSGSEPAEEPAEETPEV
jgi:hypothetical protein